VISREIANTTPQNSAESAALKMAKRCPAGPAG
jgi:hypothetical protein